MDSFRRSPFPNFSNDPAGQVPPFPIPNSTLAAIMSGLQAKNNIKPHSSTPPIFSVDIRPSKFRLPSPPRRDEQEVAGIEPNRSPEPPHAPTRAHSVAQPLSADSGRLPAIRTTTPQGLSSPAPGGASPTISAAGTAAVRSTRPPSPPQASLQDCRRPAHPRTTGPPGIDSSQVGDSSHTGHDCRLPLDGIPHRSTSSPAREPPLRPTAVKRLPGAADSSLLGRSTCDTASLACSAAVINHAPPFGSSAVEELTGQRSTPGQTHLVGQQSTSGQTLLSGQRSTLRRPSVTFKTPDHPEPSLAASSVSTSLPAYTPQSPPETAPLRDTTLAASLHAAPSAGHLPPPVLPNTSTVASSTSMPLSAFTPQSPSETAPLRDTSLAASHHAAPSTGHLPPPVLTDAIATSTSGSSFRSALLNCQTHRSYNDPIASAPMPI